MVVQNAVLVEAVLAEVVVALLVGGGVGAELLAVGVGFPARRRIGDLRQSRSVVLF